MARALFAKKLQTLHSKSVFVALTLISGCAKRRRGRDELCRCNNRDRFASTLLSSEYELQLNLQTIIASSTRTNAVQSIFKAFSRQMLHNSQLTVVVAGRGRYRRAALCSDNRRRQHRYGSHGACTLFKSTSDKLAQKAIRNSVPNK